MAQVLKTGEKEGVSPVRLEIFQPAAPIEKDAKLAAELFDAFD